MQFCVRDEVEHFEESFHPYYDAIKIDEDYFEDREGHERAAITLVKQGSIIFGVGDSHTSFIWNKK